MTAKALEVFVGLPVVLLAAMGVLVAVGVLLDTFVVRSVLVPALALDLGPHIWWPSASLGGGLLTRRPRSRSRSPEPCHGEPRSPRGRTHRVGTGVRTSQLVSAAPCCQRTAVRSSSAA